MRDAKSLFGDALPLVEEWIQENDKNIDIEVFKKMKTILNSHFLPENNQIKKMDAEEIAYIIQTTQMSDRGFWEWMKEYKSDLKRQLFRLLDNHCKSLYIVVKFPEITITNSKGRSHNIKDLYVRMRIDPKGKFIGHLEGVRGTFTQDEAAANYSHSHLNAYPVSDTHFSTFCTGVGEINQVISLLYSGFDEVNFILFCMHLKEFVKWESIEGMPYIRFENVANARLQNNSSGFSLQPDHVKQLVKWLFDEHLRLNIPFTNQGFEFLLSPNGFTVSLPEDKQVNLKYFIQSQVRFSGLPSHLRNFNANHLLVYIDGEGQLFSCANDVVRRRREITPHTNTLLIFKDQHIKINVLSNDTKEEKIKKQIKNEKYVHPAIISSLCTFICKEFTKDIITSQDLEGGDSLADIREAAKADLFSM